ncbi:hypothetical protein C8A01DRAFT_38379 [Parachaetomium inaequale]|uniref:C2H2-type domain-containing protein n=1 Tax=Parachaetomium inaequale TaxID=2588326 RepID=A0AAN6SPW6_9PEZI|nr:hypothetical protein C8A01DRAFT_38379 [Parachaetomium inaequale]
MASERGPTAAEAPRAPSTSTVPQTTPPFGTVAELARSKSLKRQRETTPTSQDSLVSSGDISPSKIARLVGFARQSHPSTDEVARDEENREEEDEHQQLAQLEHTDNHPATDDLMTGVAADMSRPQDAPPDTGHSDIEAAAAVAAARALSSVTIPTSHVAADDLHHVSPQSGTSGASLEDGDGHVVDSPTAMDVDSRNDESLYAPQPEAPMEDKTGASLSYPGAMPAPGHPQRMMSMPLAGPQTPTVDLTPRSPNSINKKHKCPYCETEFTRHHNLKSHLLTHSQEKPYVCQSCQMRFRRLHDLKRHSKLHTGEKPHVCPSCDRKFARGDALARHSKGAGGCAGRRQTIGSFGLKDDYDGTADSSAMSGELYEGGADMSEEERRHLSMPSIKPQHVAGQAGAEGYGGGHSNTYPPAGQRQGAPGGLYPPNVDRGSSSTNTSPSMPSSHTPQTSISSVPLSAGSSTMYSQSGMTESPKPLSPGGAQANAAGQQRAGTEQQQGAPGLSLPTHGNAAPGQHAAGRGRARAASGAAPPQGGESSFGQPDPTVWTYFQHLEGTVKRLSTQMETEARSKAQLVEKLNAHEQHIAALTAEVAALRQQFAPPQEEGTPADAAAAQQ